MRRIGHSWRSGRVGGEGRLLFNGNVYGPAGSALVGLRARALWGRRKEALGVFFLWVRGEGGGGWWKALTFAFFYLFCFIVVVRKEWWLHDFGWRVTPAQSARNRTHAHAHSRTHTHTHTYTHTITLILCSHSHSRLRSHLHSYSHSRIQSLTLTH